MDRLGVGKAQRGEKRLRKEGIMTVREYRRGEKGLRKGGIRNSRRIKEK